jgi:hypothetical protein
MALAPKFSAGFPHFLSTCRAIGISDDWWERSFGIRMLFNCEKNRDTYIPLLGDDPESEENGK